MGVLVECPECKHQVSDRAPACPQCGFPVAASLAEERERAEAAADRAARSHRGDVDCAACDARGFTTEGKQDQPTAFSWCEHCQHSGRVPMVQSPKGYWAVAVGSLAAFVAGEDLAPPYAVYLGTDAPQGHRYDRAGRRHDPTS